MKLYENRYLYIYKLLGFLKPILINILGHKIYNRVRADLIIKDLYHR